MKLSFVIVLAGALISFSAAAHPTIDQVEPFPDTTVVQPPTEIKLTFSEAILLPYSGIKLSREGGETVETAPPVKSKNDRELVVPIAAQLVSGTYRVEWHAVSTDTHRVEGAYTFMVIK